ncbi:dTDP-6-deoxy-3,4-keto-hexulose isomerase [Oleiphilus sp. HI0118]|nr:dTDP-6-deoxy-3,4-keto-hexulose isomerase [Oleiphilus sp. HI0118]
MGINPTESDVKELLFSSLGDSRGELIALEQFKEIPFEIKRIYYIFQTAENVKRGFHAHQSLKQVAIALSGSCVFDVETESGSSSHLLDSPSKGLYMGGLVWREMRDFSHDCVLLVIASECYDEADYIRSYDAFKHQKSLLAQ